ncbi:MAG: hypothetical protein NVS3B24_14640 [Candidatus Dormibacteria bacterium]
MPDRDAPPAPFNLLQVAVFAAGVMVMTAVVLAVAGAVHVKAPHPPAALARSHWQVAVASMALVTSVDVVVVLVALRMRRPEEEK